MDERAEREARRAERRRQVRRRRIIAFASLAAVVIAVGIVVAIASGGGSGGSDKAGTGKAAGQQAKNASNHSGQTRGEIEGEGGKVRNSTPQPDWEPHTGPVPILEYHVLGEAPESEEYPELFVSRPDFRHQLEWLDENGYQAVTLEQVQDAWYRGGTLPPKPVVLSFDDGYRPQFTFALPQLRKHGWAGVLNLKAEGSDLYESNVKAMIAAGWELASHTVNHSDLTTIGPEELEYEVAESRKLLQREFGVPVKNFCYPAGAFDSAVIEAVEAAGYEGATTEIPGYAEKNAPYELARFEILGSTGVEGLAEDLASGEGETAEGVG
ncbi:MAG TPA: polysaccharide deacetylase family protein [Solirubrobacterales bacterium]